MSITVCFSAKSSQKMFDVSRVVGHFANQGHVINIIGEAEITNSAYLHRYRRRAHKA